MTNLLHRSNKSVTVHNKCSKIQPSTSMRFANRVRRSRLVLLSWSSRFSMQTAAKKASEQFISRIHFSFVNGFHPIPKTKF